MELEHSCLLVFNVFLSRQVIAMEPETEPFLWVNSNQTALVIGNSVSSQLPPSLFMPDSSVKPKYWVAPLIDQMTRLLAPCLHPNAPSLKLRTSILICGPAGMTWKLLFLYIADWSANQSMEILVRLIAHFYARMWETYSGEECSTKSGYACGRVQLL